MLRSERVLGSLLVYRGKFWMALCLMEFHALGRSPHIQDICVGVLGKWKELS
jgi:hypothetical protein